MASRPTDTLTPAARSERMARVKGRNTGPEMVVRRVLHAMGFRYRLHAKDLPGSPDIVFRGRRQVILVHGCFWHRHPDPACRLARLPKLERNRERDLANLARLEALGWTALLVWECELRDRERLGNRLRAFLEGEA